MIVKGEEFDEFRRFIETRNIQLGDCISGVGKGWIPLLERLCDALDQHGWNRYFVQVKEKFGILRIYLAHGAPEKWHELVAEFEAMSAHACEECGARGELRPAHRWLRTLCDACNARRK